MDGIGVNGYMVAIKGNNVEPVPLEEVAGKLKYVPVDAPEIMEAKNLGISFGD